ncbi:hypothetical protein PVAND_001646 [Polypedilum vanderplanki]|uniref:Uncharacterized protein n=1 Tax=Polypedilum vanderplanki TaxID=319348 RepID=A0A9J6BNU6_POLVA|nr:hypothetical protein PVAND_001646 [Polypedilum vanderplanki]
MVMEAAIPSPLVVGREFVRQYYTLLHNSPDHLHRFYNQHSSFTHSGLDIDPSKEFDGLVIGQKNIHDKIQQMNFRDCHAKISHVDAQATLGDGVVVQVFGELSNDGHQMRRFTQTFVLACQSPKKYYVHNDIFRYHDIYNEEDEQREEHEGTESSTTPNNTSTDGTATILVQPNVYYPSAPASVIVSNQQQPQLVPAGFTVAVPAGTAAQVNGVIHEEMLKNIATQTSQQAPPPQIIPAVAAAPAQTQVLTIPMAPVPAAAMQPIPVEPVVANVAPEVVSVQTSTTPIVNEVMQFDGNQSNEDESDALDNSKESEQASEEPVSLAPKDASPVPPIIMTASTTPSAPKNWANLVKAGPGIGYSPQPEVTTMQTQSFVSITQQQQQQAQQQKQAETYGNVDRRQAPPPRDRDQRERRVSSNVNNDSSCQLFLGNLPTSATEEELRQMFSVFGKIADLRIHTKQPAKPGGRPVPNYGFITFEDPQSAIKLQDAQPIFYPVLNDKSGQKINIEHKIRKNADGQGNMNRSQTNGGQNMDRDRGRNNNPGGGGMNRNGSGGRSDRRDDRRDGGNRQQFNRSDRMGQNRTTNGNTAGNTYTNSRR